ncbi:MAG: AraC family transcriptional regulator [Carnobacterium sp.]|uniref:AraC family transcriptional regulator n=2 Tax=Carnobacterium sp. TaxID=48221 RepID=UPI002FCBB0BB
MKEDFFELDSVYNDIFYLTKGHEQCVSNHSFGPAIREYFILHIILTGKGQLEVGDNQFHLHEGQFFILYPNTTSYYKADAADPWEYGWIGFDGRTVEKLFEQMGLNELFPVGDVQDFANSKELLLTILAADPFDFNSRIKLQGYFYLLLANLSKKDEYGIQKIGNVNKQVDYTQQVIRYIKENYWDVDFRVAHIADQLSLNDSYLTSIFKKITYRTPKEYLLDYRIQKSREYLEATDLSIAEVAYAVGYKNSVSFTRIFKKKMLMTPREYSNDKKQ